MRKGYTTTTSGDNGEGKSRPLPPGLSGDRHMHPRVFTLEAKIAETSVHFPRKEFKLYDGHTGCHFTLFLVSLGFQGEMSIGKS